MNFQDNSENKNRKIYSFIDSGHSASFMKVGSKLIEGGGVCISLVGTEPKNARLCMKLKGWLVLEGSQL